MHTRLHPSFNVCCAVCFLAAAAPDDSGWRRRRRHSAAEGSKERVHLRNTHTRLRSANEGNTDMGVP